MSDQPETLAAVLADYRSDIPAMTSGELPHPTPEYLRILLDRIEAAAERERDEDRQLAAIAESDEAFARCARCDRPERATGNAAALREALEKIRHEYGWGLISCRTCVSSEADVERVSDLFEKQIDAALAAPPRNCDRFATAEEAYSAWMQAVEMDAICDWLFAPAEGGDHE